MKISRILFKARWQDKDAAVRLAAVTSDSEAELVAALPDLTRADPDAHVRLAALKRLGDYECWRERSTADSDAEVRRVARATYVTMFCSGAASSPALPRLIAELDTLSAAEIETVATAATDRDVRAAALAMVTRPALLVERAGADPDPGLRLAALQRITDTAALERIAERTRKSDKTINRAARERLQALQIRDGNVDAIAARARTLCERLDALVRDPGVDAHGTRLRIEDDWATLGPAVPDELTTRFNGAVAVLTRAPMLPEDDVPIAVAAQTGLVDVAPPEPSPAGLAADPVSAIDAAEQFAARARFDAALAATAELTRQEREKRDTALAEIERRLALLSAALDAGDTATAHAQDARIASLVAELGARPRSLDQQLAPLHARLAEFRRWQHWSNQRRRRALCTEIEALAQSGLHPDAIATRVQEARTEWARLDAIEGGDRPGNSSGITRQFFAACQRALKPAHAYFAKRDTVRDAQREQIEALLQRHSALSAENDDWKATAQLRQELATSLRSLDALNPRDRNVLAKRLKEAIGSLASRLDQHAGMIEAAKSRLIEQARALAQHADRNNPRAARELQQQWTQLGAGARSTDQKQWREFRKACDQVFAALDDERKQRDVEAAARVERASAIIADAEQLLADSTIAIDTVGTRRRELESRWRECGNADRGRDRRFAQVLEALAGRAQQYVRTSQLARYTKPLEVYARLSERERRPAAVDAGGDSVSLAPEFSALAERAARALPDPALVPDEAALEDARGILVQLEFLGGVPSPAEDAGRRMNYQVSRLSARMRGDDARTAAEELTSLMSDWFALPAGMPDDLIARFEQAARSVIATLP